MGATPTPWQIEIDDQSGIGRTHSVYICDHRGWPDGQLARINVQDGLGERDANALLIVTAVNNHAALKDAITTAAEWFEEYAAEHNRKAQDAPPGFERDSREVKAKTNANRAKFLRLTLSAASASETGKEG